jgi:glycosyltransferase involved in cell wall biosynthesis
LDSCYQISLSESDYEIIVIDDCSQDNSVEVISEMARNHDNLHLVCQNENYRVGTSLNIGIKMAKGEYIQIVGGDDIIVDEGITNALNAVKSSRADICYFDFEYEQSDGQWYRFEMPSQTHNTILSSADYLNNYYSCLFNASWRSMYRTEFLRDIGISFVEGVRWEDCDWTVKVYSKAKQIQFVGGVGYRYAYGAGSVSHHRLSGGAMAEIVYAGLRLMEYGDEIKEVLSGLSKVVSDEGRYRYVHNMIRLRNLTKYPLQEIKAMYDVLGSNRRQQLLCFGWYSWDRLFLKHRIIALIMLSIGRPLSLLGRWTMKIIRNSR